MDFLEFELEPPFGTNGRNNKNHKYLRTDGRCPLSQHQKKGTPWRQFTG